MAIEREDIVIGESLPYLRPFICKGNWKRAKVMLTGINPATPISPVEISYEDYRKLLEDYDSFLVFYQKKRKQAGKTALSRTRQGIGALVEFIWKETGSSVIETDVCTYPTASVKELERVDGKLKQKGRELFWKVLEESGVELVICYGKQAFEDFFLLLEEQGVSGCWKSGEPSAELLKRDCAALEKMSPVGHLEWKGRRIVFFVVRHLMYYGKSGASYEEVKQKIAEWGKSCNI